MNVNLKNRIEICSKLDQIVCEATEIGDFFYKAGNFYWINICVAI